tara:strand:- start:25699 stop:25935 length:237 start_codon:yes stop_codon:yes gene_type:complete
MVCCDGIGAFLSVGALHLGVKLDCCVWGKKTHHPANRNSEELVDVRADAVVRRADGLGPRDAGEEEVGLCGSKRRALV